MPSWGNVTLMCLVGSVAGIQKPPATVYRSEHGFGQIYCKYLFGAGRGGRTLMSLRTAAFEADVSANSTIPALLCLP